MSSGMQNAQNFAAIISSMVLEPSFFDLFFDFGFSWDVFPKKGHLARLAAPPGGAPLLGAPGPKNIKHMCLGVLRGGGRGPSPLGPISLLRPYCLLSLLRPYRMFQPGSFHEMFPAWAPCRIRRISDSDLALPRGERGAAQS